MSSDGFFQFLLVASICIVFTGESPDFAIKVETLSCISGIDWASLIVD